MLERGSKLPFQPCGGPGLLLFALALVAEEDVFLPPLVATKFDTRNVLTAFFNIDGSFRLQWLRAEIEP